MFPAHDSKLWMCWLKTHLFRMENKWPQADCPGMDNHFNQPFPNILSVFLISRGVNLRHKVFPTKIRLKDWVTQRHLPALIYYGFFNTTDPWSDSVKTPGRQLCSKVGCMEGSDTFSGVPCFFKYGLKPEAQQLILLAFCWKTWSLPSKAMVRYLHSVGGHIDAVYFPVSILDVSSHAEICQMK